MAWLKIDDGFTENQKIAGLSHPAFRLHVTAMCHSARTSANGEIAPQALRIITATAALKNAGRHVDELVSARLWLPDGAGGYRINDWRIYNGTTAEKVAACLEKQPEASANEVWRIVGGDRNQVLAEVRKQKEAGTEAVLPDQYENTGLTGMDTGIQPDPSLPLTPSSKEETPLQDAAPWERELLPETGREMLLIRLVAAMGGGDTSRQKVDNALRRHTISEADLVQTIEAVNSRNARDRVAIALSELAKRRRKRVAA